LSILHNNLLCFGVFQWYLLTLFLLGNAEKAAQKGSEKYGGMYNDDLHSNASFGCTDVLSFYEKSWGMVRDFVGQPMLSTM
jgi:hypothetical protein